jgi:uncharacterized protein DUF2786
MTTGAHNSPQDVEERRAKMRSRVAKLLAHAEGTTFPEEAWSAYAMAQRIMLENGLTAAEVDALPSEEQQKLVADEAIDQPTAYWREWCMHLQEIIANNHRVKSYYGTRPGRDGTRVPYALHFVGLADDVALARAVYRSVCQTAPRLAKAYSALPGRVEAYLAGVDVQDLQEGLRYYQGTPQERRDAHRRIQRGFLEAFLEGLADQYKDQLASDQSLALMLTVPLVVQERFNEIIPPGRPLLDYEGTDDVWGDRAADEAGYAAGRAFRAEPTRRPAEDTAHPPAPEADQDHEA